MSRIIQGFTDAFNQALETGLNFKLNKMQLQNQQQLITAATNYLASSGGDVETHDDLAKTDYIHLHGTTTMSGVTYDNVAKIVNTAFPNASVEEKTEYYNAIQSGLESAQIFLQHCKNQDIQLRVLQLNADGSVKCAKGNNPAENKIYFNTLSEYYQKGKDFFKQATNVKFLGSIVQIRNTSGDNGNALDVSIAMRTSNTRDFNDADLYDGAGSNISVYNKQSFVKFLPSSRYAYKTESLQKILSAYRDHPKWEEKKEKIYAKLAETLGTTVDDLKSSGNSLRCISKSDPVDYEGVLDFNAFKERSCGVDPEIQYPGTVATLFDTYLKLTTVAENTPYVFTVYGLFLLDKTVNSNINVDLSAGEGEDDADVVENKYEIATVTEEEVEQEVEDILNEIGHAESRFLKIKAKSFQRMNIPIVVSGGKFVKEYEPGTKLEKGQKVLAKTSTLIKPK